MGTGIIYNSSVRIHEDAIAPYLKIFISRKICAYANFVLATKNSASLIVAKVEMNQ